MPSIKVMVNGIPGNVAQVVAGHVLNDKRFQLVAHSLTGPEITADEQAVAETTVGLIRPDARDEAIESIKASEGNFISVDFTHPSAVFANAEFYCRHGLPFVMGTTGGDYNRLEKLVVASTVSAVIAPNMAKQIVGFQAMMEYAATNFAGLFEGYTLQIRESHQQGKADTSGTAKAMVRYFNALGTPFSEDRIIKERDPKTQQEQWGIPQEYIGGHAWHTYTLDSLDKTVRFQFSHNVNGREIYAFGTLDAVAFLYQKLSADSRGKVYSMIDVLKKSD
ncbi:MAG: dihydrodipicolinate reductase [Desulfobacterales bacterium]|nr:dihydrodipicolinate reductase [Desulfobacterales bacterium]